MPAPFAAVLSMTPEGVLEPGDRFELTPAGQGLTLPEPLVVNRVPMETVEDFWPYCRAAGVRFPPTERPEWGAAFLRRDLRDSDRAAGHRGARVHVLRDRVLQESGRGGNPGLFHESRL